MTQWAEIRHLHLVEKRAEEADCATVAVGHQDGPPRPGAADPAGAGVARRGCAAWTRGGSRSRSGSDQDRRLTAKRIRRLLLPLAGPVAARTVRRYVAALKVATAPKEGYVHRSVRAWDDDGGRRRRIVGRGRGSAACKVKYLVATLPSQQRVFRQGVSARAARVAARRDRIGVHVFRRCCGPGGPRQHVAGGQAGAGRPGPGGDRGVRGVPGRLSVSGRVLCAGEGLGEGLGRDGRHVCPQPGVPAAAWRWRAGRRSMRCSSRSWRPTFRCATSTTGARCRTRGRLERQHLRALPVRIVPRPAASSRGWPTRSGMCGWTTSPIRCRSATPTGQCG